MCLLISNTPGFDNISHMSALVVDLGIVTHCRCAGCDCIGFFFLRNGLAAECTHVISRLLYPLRDLEHGPIAGGLV